MDCEKLGTDSKGNTVWKWTLKASDKKSQSSTNEGIIFNDGTNQTADLAFKNGGYYNEEGLQGVVTPTENSEEALSGLPKGIYIINNKKFVIK